MSGQGEDNLLDGLGFLYLMACPVCYSSVSLEDDDSVYCPNCGWDGDATELDVLETEAEDE